MAVDPHHRRQLITRGHALQPKMTIAAEPGGPSSGVVEHVRRYLSQHDLLKVRIRAENRADCDSMAAALAAQVPCEMISRVGRAVLLYRSPEETDLN